MQHLKIELIFVAIALSACSAICCIQAAENAETLFPDFIGFCDGSTSFTLASHKGDCNGECKWEHFERSIKQKQLTSGNYLCCCE